MAIIKAVNSSSNISTAINYVTKKEKTEEKLISGIDCNPKTSIEEMKTTKELYDKATGRQYYHFIQSFNPTDRVEPQKAHQIGLKWLESIDKFKGYEIVLATHKDKEHIHNHFIINSVSFETGLKLHTNKKEYQEMKDISNQLSKEHGLTVPKKSKEKGKITSFKQEKYKIMEKHFQGEAKSYVIETALSVKKAREKSISKNDFINEMENQGYQTNWTDTRKHVTFKDKETGKKVRLANLEKTFNDLDFTKGGLTSEFKHNFRERERSGRIKKTDKRNKGTQRVDEELYQGSNGQRFNQSSISLERDTSDREYERASPRTDDFDIERAKEHIRKSTRENARSIGTLSEPDARTREIERKKARKLEQENSRKHERRIERSRSKSNEITR